MENFLFPVIKVKVIKVIKGFGGNGIYMRVCHKSVTHPFFVCVSIYSS